MVFCSCSFSLMFYGINFLRPASGCFLYLVSKGRSAGCARNDNSVSFHHAMFAHQCRNSEKYGINFFPYSSYWVGIKKHTLEGWVGLLIAKLLERNKVKRLSLFGSFLAFEKRTPPIWEGGIFKQPLYFSLLLLLPHLVLYLDAGL